MKNAHQQRSCRADRIPSADRMADILVYLSANCMDDAACTTLAIAAYLQVSRQQAMRLLNMLADTRQAFGWQKYKKAALVWKLGQPIEDRAKREQKASGSVAEPKRTTVQAWDPHLARDELTSYLFGQPGSKA
jgi:hypothetical protein